MIMKQIITAPEGANPLYEALSDLKMNDKLQEEIYLFKIFFSKLRKENEWINATNNQGDAVPPDPVHHKNWKKVNECVMGTGIDGSVSTEGML